MVDILGIEALVGTAILILYILSAHIIELKKVGQEIQSFSDTEYLLDYFHS
jgi:hypothetical protein